VTIHTVAITVILYLLQFVSSVTVKAGIVFGGIIFLTQFLPLKLLLVTKHLIAFSFAPLLIVLTGSQSLSVFLLNCLWCVLICLGVCVWDSLV